MIASTYKNTMTLVIGTESLEVNIPSFDPPYCVVMDCMGSIFMFDYVPTEEENGMYSRPSFGKYRNIASLVEVDPKPYAGKTIEVGMFHAIINFNTGLAE